MSAFNILSVFLISSAVVFIVWTTYTAALNKENYTKIITFLCLAECIYIFGYTMELNSTDVSQIIFWNNIQYIGIPYISALWLATASAYTGFLKRHSMLYTAVILFIPVLSMLFRFTNDYHRLYFASSAYASVNGRLFFIKTPGPWMYVQTVYFLLSLLSAMYLFICSSVRSKEKMNGKIILTSAASAFIVLGLLLTVNKPFGLPLDYMACCLPIACIIIIIAVVRFDLLEIKSIARNRIFDSNSDAILLINRENKLIDFNKCADSLLRQIGIVLSDDYLDNIFRNNKSLLSDLTLTDSCIIKLNISGTDRYYDITTQAINDKNVLRGRIKSIRDVTDVCRLTEELKKLAMTDDLSTLCNRRSFIKSGQEWVTNSIENGNILHLAMLDLDFFKDVNDRYGHATGDLVIRDFSQILIRHFGSDSLTARLGGEEFAVLHMGYTDDEMLGSLKAFINDVENHVFCYFSESFHVTVSIGMAKRAPGQLLDGMMRQADKELYRFKDNGRNCISVSVRS